MTQSINSLLNAMWQDYLALTPDAKPIHDYFASQNNGSIVNDHIALRTFNHPKVCIEKIARPFVEAGYVAEGEYEFPVKKLYAKHYRHPDDTLPKVFISELLIEELSDKAQTIIHALLDQLPETATGDNNFCYSGRPWAITTQEYKVLAKESEYASWLAAHGFRPNHFTISINHLTSHSDIHTLNQTLLGQNYVMNDSGGLVKGTPEVLLEQSSTKAKNIQVTFSDGVLEIPGCYYEFALRYPMPDGQLYQGFVAASADKIFESTDLHLNTPSPNSRT
ncbi:succinyldiaminopimelate aminotransferase [Endozoicomonas sp. (ex Bugula neritina AB1)]|nr:succinyldiaminopimelate aminotransferase [Endozoicomonas sp. (ex Bugula neritina AB1)]